MARKTMLDRLLESSLVLAADEGYELLIAPGGWVFEPTPAQMKKTAKKNPALADGRWKEDADGNAMCLIVQPTVFCELRSWQGVHPKSGVDKELPTYFVPLSACQKCLHFGRKGRSHIVCRLSRAERASS